MPEDDVTLMLAFKRGDYNAFSVLVERYQKSLIQFFYAQSSDSQQSEDCTQEVWRKVFRSRADYVPRARFKTYLFRVARNHWIDVYRTRSKQSGVVSLDSGAGQSDEGGGLGKIIPDDGPEPEADLSNRELRERIEYALGRLPDTQREVFILAEFQEMKYSDISETLEIPVGTVKSRMFNAVRRLRELLSKV